MGKKLTLNDFITKANLKHSNKYNYSLSDYKNSKTKIKIICPAHGVFEQRPSSHLFKKGCPICGNTTKLNIKDFINKANKIHNNKYDYSLVDYKNAKTKINIICNAHGIFNLTPSSHIDQKTGCPICSKKHKYNNNEFIEKARIIHGNKYNYNKVNYVNNYTKIDIICKKHGLFKQTPTNHLCGKGCEICSGSKNENIISLFLDNNKINYIPQFKFNGCINIRKLPFDFYLPELNMCIEYNGKQHYTPIEFFGGYGGFIKQKKRDEIKKKYCTDNNLKLLIIKYNENVIDKLSNILISC